MTRNNNNNHGDESSIQYAHFQQHQYMYHPL